MRQNRETRAFQQAAKIDGESTTIVGYAVVWDAVSEVIHERGSTFREVVRRGAFTDSLPTADVMALYDHNTGTIPLGRNKSGTLRLVEDEVGLRVEIDPPDTTLGRDIVVSLKRGDLDKMSFGFVSLDDEFRHSDDGLMREIRKADIFDVSVVAYPAYPDTTVAARKLNEFRSQQEAAKEAEYLAALAELDLVLRIVEAELTI